MKPSMKPKPLPSLSSVRQPIAPHPAKNLGPHLKKPTSGEYETSHHRVFKKR